MTITLWLMVVGLLLVYFSPSMMVTVPAGHLGVRWYRFFEGTDLGEPLPEGTHLKFPWDELYVYNARVQLVDREYDLITKEGLSVIAHISFLFRVNDDTLGILHKEIGTNYLNSILIPELGSIARTVVANYGAEELYSSRRLEARDEILHDMRERLRERNAYSPENVVLFDFDKIMIRSITLPERISNAIESKIEQYQRQLEYDFRIEIENKEKERKRIEGEGVHDLFSSIGEKQVANYLRLNGINATLELARSNNAKIVISGSSLNALPLLIGNDNPAPVQDNAATAGHAKQSEKVEMSKKDIDLLSTMPSSAIGKLDAAVDKTKATEKGKKEAN